jgi:predicted nucleic acid-binding protein
MQADFKVILDACVLANFSVCDLFLRLAETPRMYVPQWSTMILDEVSRTHQKLGWPEKLRESFRAAVEGAFPEAMVTAYEPLIASVTNSEKDRHVLAAAIRANAELIVTFNLRHFPATSLEPYKITAMHPAEYLITLYGMNSGVVVSKLEGIARQKNKTPQEILKTLHISVPAFATHVSEALNWSLE